MSQVLVELDVPNDLRTFKLPTALDKRLRSLLDKQDTEGRLSHDQRAEAKAITELIDTLSLLKLRAQNAKCAGG